MRRILVLSVALAACHGAESAPQPVPPPPPPLLPRASAVMQVKTEAGNDFAHLSARLGPLLAPMRDCLPRADLLGEDADPLTIALDAFDDHLVACAQMVTMRGGSVFGDVVSYACWNVDPATLAVTRRDNLGRSYFQCQDGSCTRDLDRNVPSFDGAAHVLFDEKRHDLNVRGHHFPAPPDLTQPLRGQLLLVGHTVFVLTDGSVTVMDDRGTPLGTFPAIDVAIADEGHVLFADSEDHHALFDLATHTATPVQLPGAYAAGAVRFQGKLYAVDDARRLAVLDPDTYALRSKAPLRVCSP